MRRKFRFQYIHTETKVFPAIWCTQLPSWNLWIGKLEGSYSKATTKRFYYSLSIAYSTNFKNLSCEARISQSYEQEANLSYVYNNHRPQARNYEKMTDTKNFAT